MDRNEQIMNVLADLNKINNIVEQSQDTMNEILKGIASDKLHYTASELKDCADSYNSTMETAKQRYSEMALVLTVVAPSSLGLMDNMLDSLVKMHSSTKNAIDATIGYLTKLSD